MKRYHLLLSLAAVSVLGPVSLSQAQTRAGNDRGSVSVQYENPEKFTDMARSDGALRGADEGYLRELRNHFERVASKRLPEGTRLDVTITDVDMAGRFEPERGPRFNDVRIVKEIYPPRIRLEYRLSRADGSVLSEGERTLTDLAFTSNLSLPGQQQDPLHYEKRLVDDFIRSLRREVK